MKTSRKAEIGTVICATLRPEDLIEAFTDKLRTLGCPEKDLDGIVVNEDMDMVDVLMDMLNDYAPGFCYFGAAEGDGADFGFWPDWYAIDMAIFDGDLEKVSFLDEETSYPCLEVNDHGNVTYWVADGVEEWSIV